MVMVVEVVMVVVCVCIRRGEQDGGDGGGGSVGEVGFVRCVGVSLPFTANHCSPPRARGRYNNNMVVMMTRMRRRPVHMGWVGVHVDECLCVSGENEMGRREEREVLAKKTACCFNDKEGKKV